MGKYVLLLAAIFMPTATTVDRTPSRAAQASYRFSKAEALGVDAEAATPEKRQRARLDVDRAITYLEKSELATRTVRCAEKHNVEIIATESNAKYNFISNKISWDARRAGRLSNGGAQSPALVLLHELAHACNYGQDPEAVAERAMVDDTNYSNDEERYVITKIETPVAHELHEDVRTDHAGQFYEVKAPTDR